MAANVESMMYNRKQVPWHGLGVPVEGAVTTEEAIRHADLDWSVHKYQVAAVHTDDGRTMRVSDIDERAYVTVRMDSARDTAGPKVLGSVGANYSVIQNRDAFNFLDSIAGELKYETCGALNGGARVWMLASLKDTPEIMVAGKDPVHPYLLLSNTHDGSSSLRAMLTTIRVVCSNTLGAALTQGRGEGVTIRHTVSAPAKLELAKSVIGLTRAQLDAWHERANVYAKSGIKVAQWLALPKLLLPSKEVEVPTRTRNQRAELLSLMDGGTGNDAGFMRGTVWAAMNAVTEFSSHKMEVRGDVGENRLNSVWFGRANEFNRKAVEFLDMIVAGRGDDVVAMSNKKVKVTA